VDTRELELFVHLAETLHFGRTGERMHLSASAVSRSVQRMEQELGQRLLERDNRSVRLTPAGEALGRYARQSLGQWRGFLESVRPDYEQLRGEISLYCSVTAVYSLLSGLLGNFRNRHPAIELKLHTGDQADGLERLAQGHEDLAVAALPERLPKRLLAQSLAQSPLLFIAPAVPCAVDELVRQSPIPWQRVPLILSERGLARQQVDRWCRELGIRPDIYAQVSGHEAIVSMVALGLGVGVVPELVLLNSPQRDMIRRLEVEPPLPLFRIGLCVAEQRLDNPLVRAFWESAPRLRPLP
jgi:LysR family positive regulator for ilvC